MEYIYLAQSLSQEICQEIIKKYDIDDSLKNHGFTAGGLNKTIKDTLDMVIPIDDTWNDISTLLSNELQKHLNIYIERLNDKPNYRPSCNYGIDYTHLHGRLHDKSNFMIQKYEKEKGKYVYHTDGTNDITSNRVITYLWYLNDVIEGGETEFFGGSFHIKPKTGFLLLFPSTWTFPHRGNCPLSSDKYIITGWLYQPEKIKKIINETPPIMTNINLINNKINKINTNQSKDNIEKKEFEFFYIYNKKVFQYYKYKNIPMKEIQVYTLPVCSWIFQKIKNVRNQEILPSHELFPYILSTFTSIGDIIKSIYELYVLFNITEIWFVVSHDTFHIYDFDLCIQTDLSSGITYIENSYRFIPNTLVLFVEFSFEYVNEKQEKKNKTVKELAEPFLDLI